MPKGGYMSRGIAYFSIFAMIAANGALIFFAPDSLSMIIVGVMLLFILVATLFGLLQMINFTTGFKTGKQTIRDNLVSPTESAWTALMSLGDMFGNKTLDSIFEEYKVKIRFQRESEQTLNELDDYINEETVAMRCWNGVVAQIPGTLTGIGVLGTFVGLLLGIGSVGFSSAEAALESIQTLLSGINIAFYTSIAGIIMSILFNIIYRMIWNVTTRELGLYLDDFHKYVIPTVDEQERYKEQLNREYVLERLERIPREMPNAMAGASGGGSSSHMPGVRVASGSMNEKILLPQIIQGIKENEFTYALSPKHDIHTREMLSAEAVIRWHHKKLGSIPQNIFMPIIEENGLITKISRQIWEDVFRQMHEWEENNVPYVPVALNITKVDLLSDKGDISDFFKFMIDKYNIPPRMVEIEIAMDAFTDAKEVAVECVNSFRAKGIKVILDKFDGNFVPIDAIENLKVDALKLTVSGYDTKDSCTIIEEVYDQARIRSCVVDCEGIKSMEQVKALRKGGCRLVQGSFFSPLINPDEFVKQ